MKDFLLEIGCEELPADSLKLIAESLKNAFAAELNAAQLTHEPIQSFATPRRVALFIPNLSLEQPSQKIERFGPNLEQAFDKNNQPTQACLGFARSCNVSVEELAVKETDKGKRLYFLQQQPGVKTITLLPKITAEAVKKIPLPKTMRWGDNDISFIRPVHWVILLLGEELVTAEIFDKQTTRETFGHRFHYPQAIAIKSPKEYSLLLSEHYVIADFNARKEMIRKQITETTDANDHAIIDEDLLNEVTALVEWPVPLKGQFKNEFLKIPKEVLMTSMQHHQKCFPVEDKNGKLRPYFILISNIESKNSAFVVAGNERVINARLSDAEFFYHQDLKHSLESRLDRLDQVIFQKQLGSLREKSQRLATLAAFIAESLHADAKTAGRAGLLSKCDLVSEMVYEFPDLQGIMGYYYALHDGEPETCAIAIKEQYWPRFSGDDLPSTALGGILALAERLDTLVGIFGINQAPTGEKDPFALRRAAQGIFRLLIENKWPLDLMVLLKQAEQAYEKQLIKLSNPNVLMQAFEFVMGRLKSWYHEQRISSEVFEAVMARKPTQPLDFHHRMLAVQKFQVLPEAAALSAANKRAGNILKKTNFRIPEKINASLLELKEEKNLAELIAKQSSVVAELYKKADYTQALCQLSQLREPVDLFFDKVMVMVEDEDKRNNRLVLLSSLCRLLTQVADISLL